MEEGKKRPPRSVKTVSFAGVKTLKAQTDLETAKRREALEETLRQKLDFEQKTLSIVERLLEDKVADDFLIDCARFITPTNYKDTIEERFILKRCGYPVCPNKLGNVPKQQYRISTKTNKVYDITERKCFCSNFCYKASKHFEVQISKTPLWSREDERPPDVKLLKNGERGISGEEVKILDRRISELEIENPESLEPVTSKDPSDSGSESSDPEQDFVSSLVTGGGGKDPTLAVRASLLEGLSRTVREWRTEDTLVFLYGHGHRPRGEDEEEEELDEDDLEESVERPAPSARSGGGRVRPSAPAPDYHTLRRETELINLRVQEFYRGVSVPPEEENTEDTSGTDLALPLVDSHAQHSIQKRIVSEKLNRSLRDIVGHLRLAMNDISADLNNLLRTFRFTNLNIIHNHQEWTLIAVVLLSVLSEVTPVLRESLERPYSVEYISTLMRELWLKDQDLQSLVQFFRGQAN
ncbi:hypothetical protein AAFF_G00305460 [Aldrovandia affinis]|uniref:RNA polymerase II subunit B1 CTD phosphatase RPAP2 homolog n=1 Tax=Aldrovandia affinis TaxID=143900 RepID=A0AAD7SPK8_9TELE|nr:hypothetical protein AAFF_G00305460 [Aldrovandia affinis]